MKIEIPNDALKSGNLSENQLTLELALFLYQKNIFTLETASKFAKMDSSLFQKKLGEHKIPVHYSINDFEYDLRTLNEP